MFVSQKTLAVELGVSVRAVEMAFKSFKTKKLITVKKQGRRNYYNASIPEVRFGYQESIPEVFGNNTRSFVSPTIEKHREARASVKNEPKQTAKFWEPGNPDYDRFMSEK
jgi:outer membrane receptor for Fe3+-dicitrate